jgi:alcohol oxidase
MKARQMVIVSAGAFGSPMLLERSGVGAKAILEKLDIPVVVDLPGVGLEYQDHQLSLAVYHASDDADTHDDYLRGIPEVHVREGTCWAKDGSGKVASNMMSVSFFHVRALSLSEY